MEKIITLRIDEELLKKLDVKAKKKGRKRSNMIRYLIMKFLEDC